MAKNYIAKLQVDKKIVELLSRSTYQKSFASAIRELVSNSYDADALSVHVNMKDDYNSITVEDDGNGMSEIEFSRFLTIGGSKTSLDFSRKFKRKRIGQFGVGFLAIFPFCETLEIVTTVENSSEVLSAKIPTKEYLLSSKRQYVEDIPIPCKIIEDQSQSLKHYTRLNFITPNYSVKQYFSKVETRKRDSINTWDPFSKFLWELQEDLPISFNTDVKSDAKLFYEEPIGINVFVNGNKLTRNELPNIVLANDTVNIAGIECKYIFVTDYVSIKPLEARGIKRRVNNVGIGGRTEFDLKRDRGFSRLHWISGEIHFSEKIKEYLNLARDSFVSNPVIDELNDFFAEKLRKLAYYVEDVAVSEKTIEQTIQNTKKGSTTPKSEVILDNLEKLKGRGFKVIEKDLVEIEGHDINPITFDKERKTVTLYSRIEDSKDIIEIANRKFEVQYKESSFFNENFPCKILDDAVIELNKDYSLFKSKTYGNLFKKIHILLSLALESSDDSGKMYSYILDRFLQEFNDYK